MNDDPKRPTTDVDHLRTHLLSHADVAEAVSKYGVSLDELAFFHGREFEVPYIWASGVFGKAFDADTERLIGDFSKRDIAEELRRFAADVRRSDEEDEWLAGDLQDTAELVIELRRYRVQRAVAEGCSTRDVTSEGFEQAWRTRTGVDFYADAPPLTSPSRRTASTYLSMSGRMRCGRGTTTRRPTRFLATMKGLMLLWR